MLRKVAANFRQAGERARCALPPGLRFAFVKGGG
jgi:hypothetical protein